MEFKEGKQVRVIANNSSHDYETGSIVTMTRRFNDEEFEGKEVVNGVLWWVRFSDCEEIEEKKVMEFEKGKKVRVVENSIGHCYEIGSIVTMDELILNGMFLAKEGVWRVKLSDCEEIEEKPERYKKKEVHGMDVIDLVNYWGLNFQEGNILKYLLRDKGEDESDLEKIIDYAQRELKRRRDCK